MNLQEFIYRHQPWKDPNRNFVEHDTSLMGEEGALRAGFLNRTTTVCLPDETGTYQAYDERGNMLGSSVVSYMSDETDCPRFLKCAECPNRAAETVLRLVQEDPPE